MGIGMSPVGWGIGRDKVVGRGCWICGSASGHPLDQFGGE